MQEGLHIENQWEAQTFFWLDHNITHKPCSVEIRWPNGERRMHACVWDGKTVRVSDMGKEYDTSQTRLCIQVDVHGLMLSLDIQEYRLVDRVTDVVLLHGQV